MSVLQQPSAQGKSGKMTPPWMPGENFFDDLANLAESLDKIVTRENELARENRLMEIGEMQAEKTRLAIDYHRHAKALKADPNRLRSAPKEMQQRLKASIGSFESKLQDNERLLGAAKSVMEGIVDMAAKAAREASAPTTGYTSRAALEGRARNATASIALDKRV